MRYWNYSTFETQINSVNYWLEETKKSLKEGDDEMALENIKFASAIITDNEPWCYCKHEKYEITTGWEKSGLLKKIRYGYCSDCNTGFIETKVIAKIVKLEDDKEVKRTDGKKRGRERKIQVQCKCKHFNYEHDKGSCKKCGCDMFERSD